MTGRAFRFIGSSRTTPFALGYLLGSGQSLELGGTQAAVLTTQPFSNRMPFDPSGVYDFGNPSALTLIPLVSPQKTPLSTGATPYPQNILGEGTEVGSTNAMTSIALANGFSSFPLVASSVGQGGAPFSVIKRGGSGNSYAAGIYEAQGVLDWVHTHIGPSATVRPLGLPFHHGEADSQNNMTPAAYSALEVQYQADFESDLGTLFGFGGRIPLVVSQQTTEAGSFNGPPSSALAQYTDAKASPHRIILACAKYMFPYSGDNLHLSNYLPLDDKMGEVLWQVFQTGEFTPLWPTVITRLGNVYTLTMNVPHGPLVFDNTKAAPHGPGTPWSMWGPGFGFGVGDRPFAVTGSTGAGVTPIVLQCDDLSHYPLGDLPADDAVAIELVGGNTNANGVWKGSQATILPGNQLQLNGVTGNGAFLVAPIPPSGFSPLPISNATIVGDQVLLTTTRSQLTDAEMSYALYSDRAWNATTGGFGSGRCGVLRDSNPALGFNTGQPLYNWCVLFAETVT